MVQRLNDFRVPVNSTIKLTFSRRVKLPSEFGDIDEGEYAPPEPQAEENNRGEWEAAPPTPSAEDGEVGESNEPRGSGGADDVDIDIDESGARESEQADPQQKRTEVTTVNKYCLVF